MQKYLLCNCKNKNNSLKGKDPYTDSSKLNMDKVLDVFIFESKPSWVFHTSLTMVGYYETINLKDFIFHQRVHLDMLG